MSAESRTLHRWKFPSPSISTIHDGDAYTSLNSSSSSSVEEFVDESVEELTTGTDRTVATGVFNNKNLKRCKFWRLFKPKNTGSLYEALMSNPNMVEDITEELLTSFQMNPRHFIEAILKLFMDVSGYQCLKVDDIYNFEEANAKEAIQCWQVKLLDPDLMNAGYIVFDVQGTNATIIKDILYRFIYKLTLTAHQTGILYEELFSMRIFSFIRYMAFSTQRPIRQTGIIFSLKFLTAFGLIFKQISEKLREYAARDNEYIVKLKQQRRMIIKHLNFFHVIFNKNCLLLKKKSSHVRAECLKEMNSWMTRMPEYVLLGKHCTTFLARLLNDKSNKVRLNAVLCSKQIIIQAGHREDVKTQFGAILPTISRRIYDTDFNVASETCNLFTEMLKVYPGLIDATRSKHIIKLMSHKDIKLANAAALFTVTYFRLKSNDSKELLCSIAKLSGLPKFQDHLPLMINALLKRTPESQYWSDILIMLLDECVRFEVRKLILHMLKEIIQQLVVKSMAEMNQVRRVNTCENLNSSNSNNVTYTIVPHIADLFDLYRGDNECLKDLLEIVSSLDYTDMESNYNVYYNAIFKAIQKCIKSPSDVDVIVTAVEVIFTLYSKIPHFKNQADSTMQGLVEELIQIRNDSNSGSQQDLETLYSVTLKLSKIFAVFNLTDYLKWEDIFFWNIESMMVIENLIVCSRHYLIWSMKDLLDGDAVDVNKETAIQQLAAKSKDYVASCLDILQRNTTTSIELIAFESICEILYDYVKLLEGPIKFNYLFRSLSLDLDDEQYSLLFKYLESHIVGNTDLSYLERQQHLSKVINLIYLQIAPAKFCANIFRIYSQYYNDFQHFFDSVIADLQKTESNIVPMILHTLTDSYDELLLKSQQINIGSEEFESLCLLARRLSSIKNLKANELKDIVCLQLNYVFRHKIPYQFLYLLKYFVQHLSVPDKKEVLVKFQQIVPEEDKQDDMILFFSLVLKEDQSAVGKGLNGEVQRNSRNKVARKWQKLLRKRKTRQNSRLVRVKLNLRNRLR